MRLIAVGAAALVLAPIASGALSARLAIEPRSPVSGRRSTILLFPLYPYLRGDGSCCRYERADVRYPFRLQLLGPRGRTLVVRPRKIARFRYAARVTFRVRGRWEIRVANYYSSGRDEKATIRYHGPRLWVTVR